jgi:hypothetical protein
VRIVHYASVTAAIAILYLGWTFGSRYAANRRMERALEARKAAAYRGFEKLDLSTGVAILHFYIAPGVLTKGEKGTLCYGVAHATAVRIEPSLGLEDVTPSRNRCIKIAPEQDTKYTLTAEGAGGLTRSESLVVRVKPVPARPR